MAIPEKKQLTYEFTGDSSDLDKKLEVLAKALESFNKTTATKSNIFDSANKGVVDLTTKIKGLKSVTGSGAIFPDIGLLEKQVQAGTKSVDELKRALAETIGQAKLANKVDASPINDSKIADAIIKLKALKQAELDAQEVALTFGQKVGLIGEGLSKAFLPLAGLAAGTTAILKSSSDAFADFEKTLNTIGGVAQLTDRELQQIKESSLALGQQTTFSAQQVAQSYLELSKAGFSAQDSIKAMPGLLNLAAAAGGDLSAATAAVTESLKGFGLGVDDITRFSDVLAKTANLSSTDLNELVFAFKQVGPVASQAGQPLEDISALLGILANASIKGADAGSDLRNIITLLANPTKSAAQALKALGVSLFDINGNAKPLSQVFKDLSTSLSKYDLQSRITFGKELAGAENLKSFLVLAGQAPGVIDDFRASLENAGGSTDALAGRINQGLFKSLEQASGAIETIKIKLGQSLAPAIETVANSLTAIAEASGKNDGLTSFTAGAGAAAATVVSLGAGLSGLLLLFGPLKVALAEAGIAAGPLGIAFAALVISAGALNAALDANIRAVDLSKRSISDLTSEIQDSGRAIQNEGTAALKTAQGFDTLASKANKTEAEKQKLREVVLKLSKDFPDLLGQIDDLTGGYTKLEQAIKNATAQKLAFDEHARLDDQLKAVNDAINTLQTPNTILNALSGATSQFGNAGTFNANAKQIDALNKQKDAIKAQYSNINKDVTTQLRKLDDLQKASNSTSSDTATKLHYAKASKTAADAERHARQELAKQIDKIESEITAFQEGEFAKRRVDAKNAYSEEVTRINELAAKGKVTGTPEVIQALANLKKVYDNTLIDINRQEGRARQDALGFVAELNRNIETLQAQSTLDNPFDDLEASLKASQLAISKKYAETVRVIQDNARKNPGFTAIYQQQIQAAGEAAEAERTLVKTQYNQQQIDQRIALEKLVSQNKEAQAKISGDTIAEAKASRDTALQEFNSLIAQQKAHLNQASLEVLQNPGDTNAQLAQQKALAELENYNNQRVQVSQDAEQKIAQIQIDASNQVIAAIQKRIELEGNEPQLVAQLNAAMATLVEQLKDELNLTGLTSDKRAEINNQLQDTLTAQSQLIGSTDLVGKALSGLSNVKLGTGTGANIFTQFITGLSDLRTAFKKFQSVVNSDGSTNAQKSIVDFLKTNAGGRAQALNIGSSLVQGIGDAISSKQSGLKKQLTSTITGALSGALAGFATGGPVGAAVGAGLGLVSGGASSGFFSSGAGVATAFALGGPLGFIALAAKKNADKLKKQQKQLEKTQKFIQATLLGTDKNDLNTLTGAISSLLTYSRKNAKTGPALQAVRDQITQLQQAISDRKKIIDEAVKSITLQNTVLARSLGKSDNTPVNNITIDQQNSLDQLIAARDQALSDYKDSLEAQALIEKSFELQRKQLFQSTAQAIIDELIDEQNNIATYTAATAVAQAKASGDSIGLINAQLQENLTAIDNSVAAFKGSEAEKTAFLKEKLAERTAAIKDANDQANGLLKQGLDILNEGLVTSTTKADDQKKRLQDLFGNINPLGQITASGSLVNSNVTLGSGAIQFNLQGIQDAKDLIAQINDPVIMGQLIAALNAGLSRIGAN